MDFARSAAPRRRGATVLTVLACIGVLASTVGLWANRTLFDSHAFADTATAAVTDPVVTTALGNHLADEAVSVVSDLLDLPAALPATVQPLAGPIESGLRATIATQVTRVVTSDAGRVTLGALVRHVELERGAVGGPLGTLLQRAGRVIGHLPIRTRGTFGGSVAHADPASEWCSSWPGSTGVPCRSRSHSAIRSGVRTRSVTLVVAACQPTIRCA